MKKYDVDLFVIGAGSGGVRAARIAAGKHNKKVAIAESNYYGGTCVNVGCVPKKLMTYLADYKTALEDSIGYGWETSDQRLNWKAFIERKNSEIKRLNSIYENLLKNTGVEVHWGHAEIVDHNTVRVNNKNITAERILIATGGKPFIPDIPGAREHGITSDDIFYLEEQPKTLIIAGVGYIGLEFASIFNDLGTDVHIIYRRDKILNEDFDEDVRNHLLEEMIRKGIKFYPETTINGVEKQKDAVLVELSSGETLNSDEILFATGRSPNTNGLNLDKIGVQLNENNAIIVNEEEQTTVPSIYAVGDVIDRVALTPVALAEGHALVDRLYDNQNRHVSYDNIPSAIFTSPNIGTVGLTEDQAKEKFGDDIDVYVSTFRAMKMILANNEERSLMKLIVQRSTDTVLGLHMIGAEAGEITQGFAVAMVAGATKADFDRTIGIHPTAAEEFVTMREKTR